MIRSGDRPIHREPFPGRPSPVGNSVLYVTVRSCFCQLKPATADDGAMVWGIRMVGICSKAAAGPIQPVGSGSGRRSSGT